MVKAPGYSMRTCPGIHFYCKASAILSRFVAEPLSDRRDEREHIRVSNLSPVSNAIAPAYYDDLSGIDGSVPDSGVIHIAVISNTGEMLLPLRRDVEDPLFRIVPIIN